MVARNRTGLPRVVIVGSGFAGLTLAKLLSELPLETLILDKNNYHTFQPLLYQVATGGLEAENIAYPVRKIFRNHRNVFFRMAEVREVDQLAKLVKTSIGDIPYDYLVLTVGTDSNYFNFETVKDRLLPLKSLSDALNLRSFIMSNMERALQAGSAEAQSETINIAIIGGGPTGLEMAGALAEMKKNVFPQDFPELDLSRMNICLFEAGPRLLAGMSNTASERALRDLQQMGVVVKTAARVTDYDGHSLHIEGRQPFPTDTVIWTAGVKPVQVVGFSASHYLKNGRMRVDEFNQVPGSPDIFALGDFAAMVSEQHPGGHPMLAPVAIQQARNLATNFQRILSGDELKAFAFKDRGTMATIGRHRAVVDLSFFKFHGLLAWWVWMLVHVMSLIGFRNKLFTVIQWSFSYFNYDKPLGIIIPPLKKEN